jgi:hypothetical protein
MQYHRDFHPRHLGFAAAAVALVLAVALVPAASQSEGQAPGASSPAVRSPAGQPSAGAQTALAIAGAASMTAKPPAAAAPPQAEPVRPTATDREMTADQRRQFMMLLILHETSRNPIGTLR